jgi:hypothetical protein
MAQPAWRNRTADRQTPDLREVFRELADEWIVETGDSSLIRKRITHPAYFKIIGLGPDAVPLLLRELEQNPDYWFWALHCITRTNPVRPQATFDETVQDWLTWGRAEGLID